MDKRKLKFVIGSLIIVASIVWIGFIAVHGHKGVRKAIEGSR